MRKDFILTIMMLGLISIQAVAQKIIDVHWCIVITYCRAILKHLTGMMLHWKKHFLFQHGMWNRILRS